MRISKDENVIFWVQFCNREGEAATLDGSPTISVRHYDSSIVLDVDEAELVHHSGVLYYYEFTASLDAVYCATIKAAYDDDTNVQLSQVIIAGNPSKLAVFTDFVDQELEGIDIDNPEYRVITKDATVQDWTALTQAEDSLYYGYKDYAIGDQQLLAEIRADYEGLELIGSYTLGGIGSSAGGSSAEIKVRPELSSIKLSAPVPSLRAGLIRSEIVVNPAGRSGIKLSPASSGRLKVK